MLNLHFSLLPRWRGAAPVERALLAGDEETGVCLMQLEEGLDTGSLYGCERVAIGPEEGLDELRGRLVDAGTDLLLRSLREGLGSPVPQEGEVTYAAKLAPGELRLDWSRPAVDLHRVVRLGRAWTTFRDGRLRVLRARVVDGGELSGGVMPAGAGALELLEVQPEGKRPMSAAAWLAGARPQPGERLV
jgi:methionyl-tRNA formyltransferase